VLLVTGRRLDDLRRVCPDLGCFDVVVGENGAVLEFPASGRHVTLGRRPPRRFIESLQQRSVDFALGETVVEMPAASAPTVLDAVRAFELPLFLAFNRERLMLLPPAVSKSTGLRQALGELRLSVHNAVGIGDAENDHDLLDVCEVGVAVAWGSAALRSVADEVVEGIHPSAVAGYIRRLLQQPRLSASQMGRRTISLGRQHDGTPLTLAIRGRTIVIAGEPGSGKSWLAGLVCEQMILQGYCVCAIDPEGDYRSLESLPNVITMGGDEPAPSAREIVKALRHPDVSLIVDLSQMTHVQKLDYVRTLLPLLKALGPAAQDPARRSALLRERQRHGGADRRGACRLHSGDVPRVRTGGIGARDIGRRRDGDARNRSARDRHAAPHVPAAARRPRGTRHVPRSGDERGGAAAGPGRVAQ
jgi:hypothetical protein